MIRRDKLNRKPKMNRSIQHRLRSGSYLALCILFLALMILTSCSRPASPDGSATPEERFGPEAYDADLIVMSYENVDDIGDAIVYRAPTSLETVVARSSEVIVLTIYQSGQAAMHRIQPWMEQLAADRSGELLAILASSDSQDPFLDSFEQNGWPSFFVIHNASIELAVYGYSEENQSLIMNTIKRLTETEGD